VFPDHAVLPEGIELGGAAGAANAGGANDAGSDAGLGGDPASGGDTGLAGDAGRAGDAGSGGAGGVIENGGAGGINAAGEAGAAGASCVVKHKLVSAASDAWIDAGHPSTNHGSDTTLSVLGGASELRALLGFTLPAPSAGQILQRATLILTLDPVATESRTLEAHAVTTAFNESRVTWTNYSNGAGHKWSTPGADFAADFSSADTNPKRALVRLDVTNALEAAVTAAQTTLGVLVREGTAPSSVASALTFVSREGATASVPVLDLEYCSP